MAASILEGREVLTTRLKSHLGTLVSSVEIASQNNLSSSHVVAETTLAGLLNRVYGWELVNANAIRQNCPGVDLIDEERKIAVQVTATRTVEKVRHTLEAVGKSGIIYKHLIVLTITNATPTQGMRTCTVPTYSGPVEVWNIPDVFRDATELDIEKLEDITKFMAAELGPIKERVKELPHLELPPSSALQSTGFVGREEELSTIQSRFLQGDRLVVLTGLGGMGKTELSVRYGREHPGLVYFIRFDKTFSRTLANMAMGIRPKLTEDELRLEDGILIKKVLTLLERSTSEDLLIIDNTDSETGTLVELMKDVGYKAIQELPLKLLLTTRSDVPRSIRVTPMPEEPLFEIFRNHGAELTDEEMRDLIRSVNGHTLTVDLIARTLADNWVPVSSQEMLDAITNSTLSEEDFPEVGTDYNSDPEQLHIYQRLRSVFQVANIPPLEQQILRCATLLPEAGMDVRLFRKALTAEQLQVFPSLGKRGWLSAEQKLLGIHPIIRLICRTELKPTGTDCETFLNKLWEQYDQKEYRSDHYTQMAELFTLAHDWLGNPDGRWLNRSGILRHTLSQHQLLHNLYHLRLPKLEEDLPQDSTELATAYNYYGLALVELGRYDCALIYSKKSLTIRQTVLSENDPELARSYHNVGYVYDHLGKHNKALEYQQKASKILKHTLPPDHPDLARSYNNIGSTYGDLGYHDKALEYQQKALTIWENILPPEHPNLALSYNNVGGAYSNLGDHKKALEYQQKAVTIYEKVLLPDHPDLAVSYNNIGGTYGALDNHQKGLEYKLKALDILENVLLPEHPLLAQSYNNVSGAYDDLGNHYMALEYVHKALAIQEKVLPKEHPVLALSCNNIAWTYHKLGNLSAAAQYMRKAADIIIRSSLPENHPDRVNYLKWADTLEKEAKMQQAILAQQQAWGSTPFPLIKK